MRHHEIPVVCTLGEKSYTERVQWIEALFSRSLRRQWRDGTSLHLVFDTDARSEVNALIQMEKACCAFLEFTLSGSADKIELVITVPPSAAANADDLLMPFSRAVCCSRSTYKNSLLIPSLATLSLAGGLGALMCAAGCLLPIVMITAGVNVAWLSDLERFSTWRWPLLGLAIGSVIVAWLLRRRMAYRISRWHMAMLMVASVLILLSAAWNFLEPVLVRAFR